MLFRGIAEIGKKVSRNNREQRDVSGSGIIDVLRPER